MARVGEAHIVVRAITTGVANDIKKGLRGASGDVDVAGRKAGESLGNAFSRGFNAGGKNIFSKLSDGLRSMLPNATAAANQFRSLNRTGMTVGTMVSVLIGAIGTLVGGLGALIGALGAAAPAVMGLVGTFVTLGIASRAAKFALGGIGAAVSQATQSNGALGKSVKQVREELQKLRFDAKEASLSQEEAALNVEKARNNLMRMQDLPPNSIARREADLQYRQAEEAFKRAKDRAKDLKDQLKNGVIDPNALGGNDPYAGLTESQKTFAKFLVTLKPKIDELKEALAKGFLPLLESQIERLVKEFDGKLVPVFERLGDALGNASKNFTDAFIEGGGPDKVIEVIEAALPNIEKFGTILGQIFETFLDLLVAAQPITDKFIDFIGRGIQNFSNYIDELTASGELVTFFETAGEMMGIVGDIFGNIFGGFGAIISANFGPGSGGYVLLEYLREATGSFAALDGDAAGAGSLRQYFIDVVENLKPILGLVGDLGQVLLNLGVNPAVGETFTVMREGVPAVESILNKLIEAGPNLAELGNNLGRLIDAFTDSEAPKIFFDTLNVGAKFLADFFGNETVKSITDVIGRVFAFFSAIALGLSTLQFFGNVIAGVFTSSFAVIGNVLTGLGTAFKVAALVVQTAFGVSPLGFILVAIGLVVAALAFFFTQTETGKKIWADFTAFLSGLWEGLVQFFSTAFESFLAFIQPAIDFFVGYFTAAFDIIRGVVDVFIAIFQIGFVLIATVVEFVVNAIKSRFEYVFGLLKPIIDVVVGVFKAKFEFIGKVVGAVFEGLKVAFNFVIDIIKARIEFISGIFKTVFDAISGVFKVIMNRMIGYAEGFINFFIDGLNGIIGAINKLKIPIPEFIRGSFGGAKELGFNIAPVARINLPRLAEGGTVFPSRGGSLVNVAEAGRPERIEPLDSNGLSQRDRAMIQMLAGGGSGAVINVYPSAGMNEAEIANIVSRKLAFQLRKGGF